MAHTSTGTFPIGFRRGRSPWQGDLRVLARWATQNDFPHLDLGPITADEAKQVLAAGLTIGSVDLLRWPDLISSDEGIRRDAIDANVAHVERMAGIGVRNFFVVMVPQDPARPRRENFAFAADAYGRLCRAIESTGAKIVLEGAPGKPPHFAALACTPADCRAMFEAVGSDVLGLNFDPSHAIRMGIDGLRFLREFAPRVYHVHAKDARILPDALYEHGHLQQATFAPPHRFGAFYWRYTLAGRGDVRWPAMLGVLRDAGYAGRVSIELEDEDVEGEEAEKRALVEVREFLRGC